jgi:hypothetical protein
MTTNNAPNQSSTGLQSLTSGGVFNGRTITGTANQVAITNGDGTGGNPTIALTSTIYCNISFDSGSNTLSSYVQGTFTPTITNTGGAPTPTYSVQTGRYTRIGNRVISNGNITLTGYVAGSGTVGVGSLPITSVNVANVNHTGALNLQNITFGLLVLWYVGTLAPNTTTISIDGIRSANTILSLDAAGPSATTIIVFSITYEV